MEHQLGNIIQEMVRLKMRILMYNSLIMFEMENFGKTLSKEVDEKFNACLEKYIILEEERSFLEYVLIKTD